MGCSWKAANAWKICSLITDINQRVPFPLPMLILMVSVLLLTALLLPFFTPWYKYADAFFGIFRQVLLSWLKSCHGPRVNNSITYLQTEIQLLNVNLKNSAWAHIYKHRLTVWRWKGVEKSRQYMPEQSESLLPLKTCTEARNRAS